MRYLILFLLFPFSSYTKYFLNSSNAEIRFSSDYSLSENKSTIHFISSGTYFLSSSPSAYLGNKSKVFYAKKSGYLIGSYGIKNHGRITKRKYNKQFGSYFSDYNQKSLLVWNEYFKDKATTDYSSFYQNYRSITPTKTNGKVYVKGYFRKNGTYVRPHTRSAPRRK